MKTLLLTRSDLNRGSLLLVNARHPLPESVAPERLTPFFGSGVLLERRTALVLENLFTAIGCGASLIPVSGYRTLAEQKQIYASSLAENGEEFTRKYVALPDCSEHQTGLAIDLALAAPHIDFIRPDFPDTGVCRAFREQAGKYGHSQRRELAFLTAHSMLHLCGYDHMTEEEAAVMEKKQGDLLDSLGLTRDCPDV